MNAVLNADQEYQTLKAAHQEARVHFDKLLSQSGHFKVTVGKSNGLFFEVLAQGDSWEDVIEKIAKKGT